MGREHLTHEDFSTEQLLAAIDNGLRNGTYMTHANVAFELLCEHFHFDRHTLAASFDPSWISAP